MNKKHATNLNQKVFRKMPLAKRQYRLKIKIYHYSNCLLRLFELATQYLIVLYMLFTEFFLYSSLKKIIAFDLTKN